MTEKEKVWIVIETYFNGEGDSKSIAAVKKTEAAAKEFCRIKNDGRRSSYGSTFDYEEHKVDED